ncbi:Spy/CpxP family protein refolding chaperone [Variovorax dokdonensis]|uniref:Spy/CpxP family protein refolding chaperone n=1 Tax=Variovorax dokdonensis TaxID=344883 RepID=A0ABT7NFN7_9BURK|nr:Spy/CpxP family protein refolding chaperone [Variovorax dokdonensis]MDM0046768.1 Spy/CpxP family protein refolding chaperone [Variovorax dokdonensis]
MFTRSKRLFSIGLLAGATALAASAQTTTAPAAAPSAPAATAAPAHPGMHKERFEKMQQRRAERLDALKEKLKLESSQQTAWNSYTDALKPPAAGERPQRLKREDFAKLTTPQRLDEMKKRHDQREVAFEKRATATRSFYATLSPEQQKTFDAETLRFGPGGQRHHRHHGPGGPNAPASMPEKS